MKNFKQLYVDIGENSVLHAINHVEIHVVSDFYVHDDHVVLINSMCRRNTVAR